MMQKAMTQHLINLFDQYCKYKGVKPSTVAVHCGLTPSFYDRLKARNGFTVASYDAAVQFFSANWPSDRGAMPCLRSPVRSRQ
jgi:hypothetical protein